MRTGSNQNDFIFRAFVNQQPIRLDMAFSAIFESSGKFVILVFVFEGFPVG
jgi:hypothetical protein